MRELRKRQWTVMVYMTGDRTLDSNGFADLKEMKEAGSTEEVALLAQFTRGVRHRPTKRYYLRRDKRNGTLAADVADELGEKNTADPQVLEDFVRWGVENFPARRYMLVMWGHANGADDENVPGTAGHPQPPSENSSDPDLNSRAVSHRPDAAFNTLARGIGLSHTPALDGGTIDFLDCREFKRALESVRQITGREIDILGMDACLMSGAEVCYQVRDSARFTVAPEGTAPLDGWPYNLIFGELVARPEIETEQLACLIAEKYLDAYADYEDVCITHSVCDLGKCGALAGAVDGLAAALLDALAEEESWKAMMLSRWQSQSFEGTDYVDLYDFCNLLRENCYRAEVRDACEAVMKVVRADGFVLKSVYRDAVMQYCYGLSIYFPQREVSRSYRGLDFAVDTRWADFLDGFVNRIRRPDRGLTAAVAAADSAFIF